MSEVYELGEYLETSAEIDAPLAIVWPLYLDMNRWYTDYRWEWVSGPPYAETGLQEGQVLKVIPLYGAALSDPSLWYYQEQLKVTDEAQIVVKLTASHPKSMSADYGVEVYDVVAFYHWEFSELHRRTRVDIRSYCNTRLVERPAADALAKLERMFYESWGKSLDNLAQLAGGRR